jgi:hypothetical protein
MWKLLTIISLLLVSSCMTSVQPAQSPLIVPTSSTSPLAIPSAAETPLATPETVTNALIKRAIDDLAKRLAISPDAIRVTSVTNDDFPADGWLGCGKGNSDVVRPAFVTGQSIRLQANNVTYEYRGHGGQLVFCETNQ